MRYLSILGFILAVGLVLSCSKDNQTVPPDPTIQSGSLSIKIIEDDFAGVPLVIAGSTGRNLVVAFIREHADRQLSFQPVQNAFPVILEDQYGNQYDILGKARTGPDAGITLEQVNSGMGYWFVFGAMYPGLEIHGSGTREVNVDLEPAADWLIPTASVAQGTGFDAIRALESAEFLNVNDIPRDPDYPFYLDDNDLVIVVSLNGETRAYSHPILDWHEIVNDVVGGIPVAVTYCPLTGTAKVWERSGDAPEYSFGVSGLLYNNNVLPFDRDSESFWMQLEATCVFGDKIGEKLPVIPAFETAWGTVKLLDFPVKIQSTNTGVTRDYSNFPYGSYKTNNLISFPVNYLDDRLHPKERVFSVIIDGEAKVYRMDNF